MRNAIRLVADVLMFTITHVLNVQMDLYKMKHLFFKILKNVFKSVLLEHMKKMIFVKLVILHASNVVVVMITCVQNVQMG